MESNPPSIFFRWKNPNKNTHIQLKSQQHHHFHKFHEQKNPTHTFFLRFTISCHPGGFPTFSLGYGAFRVGRMLRRSFTQVLRNLGPAAASVAFMNQEFRGEDVLLDGGRISPRSWPYPHQNYHHQKLRLQRPALLRDKQVANNPHVGVHTKLGRGFQIFFIFTPTWGDDPIWRAYFSNGLVQPPTRYCFCWTQMVFFWEKMEQHFGYSLFFLGNIFFEQKDVFFVGSLVWGSWTWVVYFFKGGVALPDFDFVWQDRLGGFFFRKLLGTRWFKVTFLGWLSDLLERLSDL